MEIIKKGIGSVSKEISIIFHKLNTSANISNLDDYIRCCSKSLAMVIFYNSNITIEKGINKLKNNADKISEYYYYIQKNELHNPDDTVNLQALVAMCRALFVTEENQKRPLLKLLFSDDGYYAGNEKNNRRSNISKDVEEFHNNNGHVRKTLCRIMLEITNLYIRMYDNSIDFFIKRLELEEKIDNVIEILLNYHDFMLLSNTLNECYWNLVVAILPDEFLQDLMGSILLKKTNIIYESNILRDILLSDYNKKRKDINELINNYIESSTLTYTK